MSILYHTSLKLYLLGSKIAGLFSKKAALFYSGRRELFNHIEHSISASHSSKETRYWFHCASVGEFEQARPLIEKIKEREPHSYIVVTFFSPSGYELRKNYTLANNVFYLPMDTMANARKFVEVINPNIVIFVKYEFWRNYFSVLNERDIPLYLVSAIFRANQPFFRWWGANFRKMLANFTHFFVQDIESETLLRSIGVTNVSVAGDTRFDRVFEITQNNKTIAALELFTRKIVGSNNSLCCVAGSTWPPDEQLLHNFIEQYSVEDLIDEDCESLVKEKRVGGESLKLVIAPHEVDELHIKKIESLFSSFSVVKFSDFYGQNNNAYSELSFTSAQKEKLSSAQIFILDTVGLLSTAYRYGNFAYVGGGFGVGIHNILEAATYGLPVVFGPNYEKFKEAIDLIALGGAFSIDKGQVAILEKIVLDVRFREQCSQICREYVQKNLGATANILNAIAPK